MTGTKAWLAWALKHKWWMLMAVFFAVIVIAIIVSIASGTGSTDWGELVTVATYGHGEKIQVSKGLLYFVGFVIWMLVLGVT